MKLKVYMIITMILLSVFAVAAQNEDAGSTAITDASIEAVSTDAEDLTEDSVDDLIVRNKVKTITECTRIVSKAFPRASKTRIANFCKNHPRFAKTVEARPIAAKEVLTAARQRLTERVEAARQIQAKPTFAKYDPKKAFKAREITKTKLENARKNYLAAKTRYMKAKENFNSAKDNFLGAKKQLQECKDDDSEECEKLRERISSHAQDYLLKTADMILDAMAKLKEKVQSSEELTEEEAADILDRLEESEQEIKDAKSTIENMDGSTPKEDVQKAAKTISQAWVKARKHLRIAAGKVVNAKVGVILLKSKNLELRLEKVLEKMEEKGLDTTSVEPLVDEFNTLLDEAIVYHDAAIEAYKADDDIKVHENARSAYKKLQEAHKKLAEILKELANQKADDILEETTVEEAQDMENVATDDTGMDIGTDDESSNDTADESA